jgi:hypothetical protein
VAHFAPESSIQEEKELNSGWLILEKHTKKYDYDKMSNWIKEEAFNNDIEETVTECEIEYY